MSEIQDLQNEIINTITRKLTSSLDDKVKECLIAWNIDLDNHEEIKRRCILENHENDLSRIKIDGYLVMMFGGFEVEPKDFNNYNNTINGFFKCSEILTPKDYAL